MPSVNNKRGDYSDRWSHIKPKYLIHAAADYIVFIDDDIDVDWETSPDYDQSGHKNIAKHNEILDGYAALETTPCHGLSQETKLHFKRLLGEAVARSFESDYSNAAKMLETARSFILARSQETSRLWYLTASFVATFPFIVGGIVVWLWRATVGQTLGPVVLWLIMSAVAGAVGALLSVIARTGKLKFDCSSGRKLHYLEGASRICAGGLSGTVVGLAIQSEMFLAPLARGEKTHAVMMITAFAAGAVERLATSIISAVGARNASLAIPKATISENNDDD
jgi:hypothetical protein